ncbi:hypothetical protein T310_9000, partial [Rasamsonia emersonii CBS 393.64]
RKKQPLFFEMIQQLSIYQSIEISKSNFNSFNRTTDSLSSSCLIEREREREINPYNSRKKNMSMSINRSIKTTASFFFFFAFIIIIIFIPLCSII